MQSCGAVEDQSLSHSTIRQAIITFQIHIESLGYVFAHNSTNQMRTGVFLHEFTLPPSGDSSSRSFVNGLLLFPGTLEAPQGDYPMMARLARVDTYVLALLAFPIPDCLATGLRRSAESLRALRSLHYLPPATLSSPPSQCHRLKQLLKHC